MPLEENGVKEGQNKDIYAKKGIFGVIQFEEKDYPTHFRLSTIQRKKLKSCLKHFNKALKKHKVSLNDLEEYHRLRIYAAMEDVAKRGYSYLHFIRVLLQKYINRDDIHYFRSDVDALIKKYATKRVKNATLEPAELLDFLNNKPFKLDIKFGVLLQALYGVRFVSIKYARFDFTKQYLRDILPEKYKDSTFINSFFESVYDRAKEIALSKYSPNEQNILKSSQLIQGNKVVFYWKGNRFEEFKLLPIVKLYAEKVKALRILWIYTNLYRLWKKDPRFESKRAVNFLRYMGNWMLPLYFPYSETGYRNWLRKIFNKEVSYHDIRRAYATLLYQKGFDILSIKEAMRHRFIVTTQRYIQTKANKKIMETIEELIKQPKKD